MSTAPAPVRKFADGDAVTLTFNGQHPVVVVSAILAGTRHPGWVYAVRRTNGAIAYAATGLLS